MPQSKDIMKKKKRKRKNPTPQTNKNPQLWLWLSSRNWCSINTAYWTTCRQTITNPKGLFHCYSHSTSKSCIALKHSQALGKQDFDMKQPEPNNGFKITYWRKGTTWEGNCIELQLHYQGKLCVKLALSINIWTLLWIANTLITSLWSAAVLRYIRQPTEKVWEHHLDDGWC